MTFEDVVARRLAEIPSVRSETAVFLGMSGTYARVRIGGNEILLPTVGFYPPAVGMVVQVEWRDRKGYVAGPATAQNPLGVVTTVEAPRATVLVDGVSFTLLYRKGYSPVVGDEVEIDWETGVIQGALSSTPAPKPEPESPPEASTTSPQPFDVSVRATDSGRFQSSWWSNDPRASNSNRGIWVYGSRIFDALKGAETLTNLDIHLPLRYEVGQAQIGIAQHSAIPGGAPIITDTVNLPLGSRAGWQALPASWLGQLALGHRGIGVTAVGGGDTIWVGTRLDPASGMLRIRGTR